MSALFSARLICRVVACGLQRCGPVFLLLLCCVQGCVIPAFGPPTNSSGARTGLSRAAIASIRVGETTMQEVLLKLGEPDLVSADGRTFAYRSERDLAFVVFAAGGSGVAGPVSERRYLSIEFDGQGVVSKLARPLDWLKVKSPEDFIGRKKFIRSESSLPAGADSSRETLHGEEVLMSGPAAQYRGPMWGSAWERHLASPSADAVQGDLVLTRSALHFHEFSQPEPTLSLRFDQMTECKLDSWGSPRWLMVRSGEKDVHYFIITNSRRTSNDGKATAAVCEFIRARMKQHAQ